MIRDLGDFSQFASSDQRFSEQRKMHDKDPRFPQRLLPPEREVFRPGLFLIGDLPDETDDFRCFCLYDAQNSSAARKLLALRGAGR